MPLKATSVRLDDETLTRVGQMAEAMDRPRAWLMAEAIKQYVARNEWFIREVEKGVKAANEGHLIEHTDIKAKWEARRAHMDQKAEHHAFVGFRQRVVGKPDEDTADKIIPFRLGMQGKLNRPGAV